MYVQLCVQQLMGSPCTAQGARRRPWDDLGDGGGGREVQGRGDVYLCVADTCGRTAETDTTLQSSDSPVNDWRIK